MYDETKEYQGIVEAKKHTGDIYNSFYLSNEKIAFDYDLETGLRFDGSKVIRGVWLDSPSSVDSLVDLLNKKK